jgi:hypothetical protein
MDRGRFFAFFSKDNLLQSKSDKEFAVSFKKYDTKVKLSITDIWMKLIQHDLKAI